jgi:hypothetical protein
MTNELEKQFFDTFGIEPHEVYPPQDELFGTREEMIEFFEEVYPQITDRILLELICIDFNENPYKCRGGQTSVDEVKERILSDFIHEFENDLYLDKENIKHQVQALFEEE